MTFEIDLEKRTLMKKLIPFLLLVVSLISCDRNRLEDTYVSIDYDQNAIEFFDYAGNPYLATEQMHWYYANAFGENIDNGRIHVTSSNYDYKLIPRGVKLDEWEDNFVCGGELTTVFNYEIVGTYELRDSQNNLIDEFDIVTRFKDEIEEGPERFDFPWGGDTDDTFDCYIQRVDIERTGFRKHASSVRSRLVRIFKERQLMQ